MAARFPGAPEIETFWRNLKDGVESITFFAPGEMEVPPGHEALAASPGYVPAAPVLADIDLFDAELLRLQPARGGNH